MHLSLARFARLLIAQGTQGDPRAPEIRNGDPFREREESSFGPLLRVRVPGRIGGVVPHWSRPAGPLGIDAPSFDQSI
jgi:hypothetical protein